MTDFFAKEGFSIADLATDSPEMMLNRPDKIIVRYGAENFEGPPKFVVKLQKKKAGKDYLVNVWRSDIITAKGGHDTGLFGRIERSEIPWMVVDLDHDPTIDFGFATPLGNILRQHSQATRPRTLDIKYKILNIKYYLFHIT